MAYLNDESAFWDYPDLTGQAMDKVVSGISGIVRKDNLGNSTRIIVTVSNIVDESTQCLNFFE